MSFIIIRNSFVVLLLSLLVADYFLEIHWAFYILLVVPFLIFVVIASSVMKFNIFVPAFTEPLDPGRKVAFTFDDGPAPGTNAVLDILKKYQVKASFFCIGNNIEKHPEILKRIVAEGHVVGNHSWSHSNIFSLFGNKTIVNEIERTNRLITAITGLACNLFRPPYGVVNPPIAWAVGQTGMKVIGWNLRSFDTSTHDPEKVIRRIKKRMRRGSVILLHDDRQHTAMILEAVLAYAKEQNYECVDVNTIFAGDLVPSLRGGVN
ncbi:polysaccharide deacetylase [Fulvivirga imtechensis AK7]|uniref:Polysaccharide deacetylase n=1 Tax=Fulvivirga imtechensis AK7 TaxID=1237149 RepID=L8JR28_9BACT|nr:polysaccharide deacetylase family protein [Fulvivirga imtechensis]ELR71310.1 polysaccharide deacetylase [Fulvivirga imtechensis AK7]